MRVGRLVLGLAPFHWWGSQSLRKMQGLAGCHGGGSARSRPKAPSSAATAGWDRRREEGRGPAAALYRGSPCRLGLSTLSARQKQGRPRGQESATGWDVWLTGWGPRVTHRGRDERAFRPPVPSPPWRPQAGLDLAWARRGPRVPVFLCFGVWFSLSDKLNLVLFANDLCLLSNRPAAGKLQAAAGFVEDFPDARRSWGPSRPSSQLVTWAEPQVPALNSEGS